MAIQTKPEVRTINQTDKIWNQDFETFGAKVYVPQPGVPGDIVNFGYSAPYFVVLTDSQLSDEQALSYAQINGLSKIASENDSSVVFIHPLNQEGWKGAPVSIYKELIENSKIHQYHENGIAILNNRFFHKNEGFAIRGAIYRICLIAKDAAADYVAKNLLTQIQGAGLWGPADIAPTVCVLENLSEIPDIQRADMPIVSVANSEKINDYIKKNTDYSLIQTQLDLSTAYSKFIRQFKRWGWVGELSLWPDLDQIGMIEKPEYCQLTTSKDNSGDAKDTKKHKVGYISYYNRDIPLKNKERTVPLVLCFHGGGDSAKHIAFVSQWYKVASDHNFLLVCVEDHINSTATEMMELLEILKKEYPIDESRIYATGFSMGGCKTWDLYQEYPQVFAGLAPMDATFDVGQNLYGNPSPGLEGSGTINQDILVPIFYAGGEETPLPELPFQAEKCRDRMEYVFKVNDCQTPYNVSFENQENWKNKIWGIDGDKVEKLNDNSRKSVLTLNYFKSRDGQIYTVFASVSGQGHECRYHTCEQAWNFISQFQRKDGKITHI